MDPLSAHFNAYPHTETLQGDIELANGMSMSASGGNPVGVPGAAVGGATLMFRELAYDLCEGAIISYMVARERGAALTALPIFITRGFDHVKLIVNKRSGVREPGDLAGKRIGVRYHGFTDGNWARAVLAEQYGVDLSTITWVTNFEEVVEGGRLPPNVDQQIGTSLDDMLVAGDLDAMIATRPGAYPHADGIAPLFDDVEAVERSWFEETGVYPIHHLMVLRQDRVAEHPDLASTLFAAFEEAKHQALHSLEAQGKLEGVPLERAQFSGFPTEPLATSRLRYMGPDPIPYGIEANAAALEMVTRLSYDLGIISRPVSIEEIFVDLT